MQKVQNSEKKNKRFAQQVFFCLYGICPIKPFNFSNWYLHESFFFFFPLPWKGLMELVICRHQATVGDGDMGFLGFWIQELSSCLSTRRWICSFQGIVCVCVVCVCVCVCVSVRALSRFSHIRFFATPWVVSHQAHLPMGFSSKNTGVGCHALLLQGIFLTQG